MTIPARAICMLSIALALIASAWGQPAAPTGSILCAYWREVPGTNVADLTSLPAYPNFANEQVMLDKLEIPENQEGEFGTVIRGFIYPPVDGTYTFYVASTNEGQVWISKEGGVSDHADAMVARLENWCAPHDWSACTNTPVQLKKDRAYYIEVRHKNGGGDNHLSVAWKLPDGSIEGPIPGSRLSPAKAVMVPLPRASLGQLAFQPGEHEVVARVEYLMQRLEIPIRIVVPEGHTRSKALPAIVYIPDPDDPLDITQLVPPEVYRRVIFISPKLPEGRSYQQRVTVAATAAAIRQACTALNADPKHLGLTGAGAGGTACWRIALELPGVIASLSPINALEVKDERLATSLKGTKVRIYVDINEGFATGRANEMLAALGSLDPKPEVVYLGEKELGTGGAPRYCYAQPGFYRDLLALSESAEADSGRGLLLWIAIIGLVAVGVVVYLAIRFTRRGA